MKHSVSSTGVKTILAMSVAGAAVAIIGTQLVRADDTPAVAAAAPGVPTVLAQILVERVLTSTPASLTYRHAINVSAIAGAAYDRD